MFLTMGKFLGLLVFFGIMTAGKSHSAEPSVAFYYASNPPVNELKAFDIVVVDPDGGISPLSYGKEKSELFAYVSLGETHPDRGYAKKLRKSWVIGKNSDWGSMVMDPSNPAWRRFFVDEVIATLWNAGYRGFFFDTMDSYQLAVKSDRFPAMEAGITTLVRDIKKRFPEARLVLNRGFEVIDGLRSEVFAVAAESIFSGYSPTKGYHEVGADDRNWLLGRLNHVRNMGIPVIAIDYARPGMRKQARETAEKIRRLGFIPWVTDKDLSSLGVGSVEVVPRKILALYDRREGSDPAYTKILRFASMPLNYLGYSVELRDMSLPFPDMILEGRYAGIVVWPFSEKSAGSGFGDWLSR
ncbi:MAG TPA: endo alpha-1,4 polygalactosaminidase, partial [Geobacteraceae bacterium]|nr:endo alpha-1,4 polygalactosaminidase [Geobacteraceae bacterium]